MSAEITMDSEHVKSLAKQGESSTVEFKTSTAQLKSAFETLCAFLNGKGGTVLIGVKDTGQLLGQEVTDSTRREIANEIKRIEPTASIAVHTIEVKENKWVIALQVNAGEHAPYVYDGRAFQRDESETGRLSQHRYEQLLVKRGQLNYSWEEAIATGYNLSDLDHEEIHRTIRDGIATKRIPASAMRDNVEGILKRLGLTADGQLKRAAVVLFAKNEPKGYGQCWLKMARFMGTDKLGEFMDNQQVYCNAFKMLEEADAFLRRHLPIASYFKPDQFKRIDKPALPVFAVREALINAICHREYSGYAGYISLAVFDDRLEIWNNGVLPAPLTLADLKRKHNSVLRNKLISKVFYVRGLIETWGTGTNKMTDLCREDKLPAPRFSERTGGLVVTFKFKEPMGSTFQAKATKQPLSVRQETLLTIVKKHEAIGIKKILSELVNPPSLRMVRKDLNFLKEMGLIDLKGHTRTALWSLKKPA